MERSSESSIRKRQLGLEAGFELDLPPPHPALPKRMGKVAMSELKRIRALREYTLTRRVPKNIVVSDAARLRVIESAKKSNQARDIERTQAILDAASKAKSI